MAIECDHPRPPLDLPGYTPPRLAWQPPTYIPDLPPNAARVVREALQGVYQELSRLGATRNVIPLYEDVFARPGSVIQGVGAGQTITLAQPGASGYLDPVSLLLTDVTSPVNVVHPDGTVTTISSPGAYTFEPAGADDYVTDTAAAILAGAVPTDTLLGRDSAGTGAVEFLTLTAPLEFSGAGSVRLAIMAADTFLGSLAGGAPGAVALADVDSASVVYDAASHTFRRAALSGFVDAAVNSNTTTSAEPIITYSASANMSAERVLTSGARTTVNLGTANQARVDWDGVGIYEADGSTFLKNARDLAPLTSTSIVGDAVDSGGVGAGLRYERAALTGAIVATQNSNATLFGGIRDNGVAENDRSNLNFLTTTSVVAVVTDDSVGDELELTWQRAALTGLIDAAQNSNATTSAEPFVTFAASSNMSAERVATSSTSVTVSIGVASQIEWQRAALTGAIAAGANANATLFSGILDNGAAETDRTSLNIVNGTNTTGVITDDAGNDRLNIAFNVDDYPLSGLADQAANTIVANATAGSAAPTAVAVSADSVLARVGGNLVSHPWSTLAGGGLAYSAGVIAVVNGTGGRLTVGANDVTWDGVGLYEADGSTFLKNARDIAVGSTTSILGDAVDAGGVGAFFRYERAALTGDVTASQNSNATTIAADAVTDTKLRNSAALSVIGRATNSSGDPADIAAANDGEVLRRSGTALGFGTIATAGLADNSVTLAKLATQGAGTVLANVTAGAAVPTAHALATLFGTGLTYTNVTGVATWNGAGIYNATPTLQKNARDLAVGSTTSIIGAYADAGGSGAWFRYERAALTGDVTATQNSNATTIATAAVTLAKMADLAQSRIIGRAEGAGTGVPTALTPTQVVAIIDGENATWTGAHSFTGATHTVDVTGALAMESDADVGLASVSGGLALGAGHVIASPNVGNGDVVINATSGIAINADAVTAVTSAATGTIAVTATDITLTAGGDVSIGATDDLTLGASDDVTMSAGGDTTVSGSTSLTLSSAAAIAVSAGSNVTIGAPGDVTVTAGDDVELAPTGSIILNSSDTLVGSGTGMISLRSGVRRTNVVPNTTNGTINDLAIGNAGIVRFTQADILTGMVPEEDWQEVLLINSSIGGDLRVDFESISSSADNRFAGFGTSRLINARDFAMAVYDGTSARWRLLVYPQ